jgi:hypothetical protein
MNVAPLNFDPQTYIPKIVGLIERNNGRTCVNHAVCGYLVRVGGTGVRY